MTNLVLDAGQTQTRVRVRDGYAERELTLPGFAYGASPGASIIGAVRAAAHELDVASIDTIVAGCTGMYGHVPALDETGRLLEVEYGVERLIVADDAVTSHLGALGGGEGAMAAVGTGLVALGRGSAGTARVDGVGAMIGDDGAGWWIGRRGIIAALSAYDGRRGGSDALRAALSERFGPVEQVAATFAASSNPISKVAEFAVDVADAASEGDQVSRAIWREAGGHIGEAIVAAARHSGHRDALVWTLTGRIGGASDLLEPTLSASVASAFPDSTRTEAIGSALDGAEQLLTIRSLATFSSMVGEFHTRRGHQ
jgi:N-acetylglucosamine kinase-like BadF-type ATPase